MNDGGHAGKRVRGHSKVDGAFHDLASEGCLLIRGDALCGEEGEDRSEKEKR